MYNYLLILRCCRLSKEWKWGVKFNIFSPGERCYKNERLTICHNEGSGNNHNNNPVNGHGYLTLKM